MGEASWEGGASREDEDVEPLRLRVTAATSKMHDPAG